MPSYLDYLAGGEKENSWSIQDVQCVIGAPIESCKGLNIDWSQDYAWKNLVDELVSTSELLIRFAIQYLAEQISQNMVRSINAVRCMFNSFGSNVWTILAGTYMMIVMFGLEGDIKPYINEGYEYVCTCTYDATQLAKYMGASEESSDVFSSCSESGSNKKEEDNKKKAALQKEKEAMAAKALKDAAALKVEEDYRASMGKLPGCLKGILDKAKCRHAVYILNWETQMVHDYHTLQVKLSGGKDSTKNQKQKDALEKGEWNHRAVRVATPDVLDFDYESDKKTLKTRCVNQAGLEVDGVAACEAANKAIHDTLGLTSPALLSKADADKAVACYEGNSTGGAKITDAAKCALVPIVNDLWQWKTEESVKCANPFGQEVLGSDKCFRKAWTDVGDAYKTRADNKGYDYPQYRTLGNDAEVPKCMNIAKTATLEGKDKCFPVWLGSTQKIDGIDQYLWLSKENAACKDGEGKDATGDKCAPSLPPVLCGAGAVKRIQQADDAFALKPYPADQWKCYSSWTYKYAA